MQVSHRPQSQQLLDQHMAFFVPLDRGIYVGQLFTPKGDGLFWVSCDKCRASAAKFKRVHAIHAKEAADRRAANIAWENSLGTPGNPVSARTAFVLEQLYLTCDLCVQVAVVNITVLQNATPLTQPSKISTLC